MTLRVLQSVPQLRPTTNPYVVQLVRGLAPHVDVLLLSWRVALLGRWDLLHLHWPEHLLEGRTPARRAAKRLLVLALVVRLALARAPAVRTVHNLRPHEQRGRLDRLLLGLLERRTTWWVRLGPATPAPDAARTSTVLLGHYRDWFAAPGAEPEPGRVAFVGLVRDYKQVPELVRAFRGLPCPDARLEVVGAPSPTALAERVRRAADGEERVALRLEHVDDDALVRAVTRASLVALPYREVLNPSAALLALSLDRPVLLPRSPAADALGAEVGEDWVLRFDPPLDAAQLSAALTAAEQRLTAGGRPDLDARDWYAGVAGHLEAYAAAVRLRSPARTSARRSAASARTAGHEPSASA